MAKYEAESWVKLYQTAFMELQHAAMRGRVGAARTEIIARVEKLKSLPGLHDEEVHAIEDALNTLGFLEREEDRYDKNERRELLESAARKLQSLEPKVKKLQSASK